ncbi:MAG TPA: hypothetical protein VNN10_12150 [Dehalococcoidia bacterium]|nr:hypothetical protein [Dehalococcoidia bacterium]
MEAEDLPRRRALILLAVGPAVFLLGFVWTLARLALTEPSMTLRAIVFAPPHQMMLVGLVIALVCVPLAAEVRSASPEDLRLPGVDAAEVKTGERSRRRRGRSYQGYN